MTNPSPSPQASSPRTVSWWVKGFVVFHIVCITAWSLPDPKPDQISGKSSPTGSDVIRLWNYRLIKQSPAAPVYLFSTGFWQFWDMFAPNPSQTDLWMDAEVLYKDGSKKSFSYPHIATLPIPQKTPYERYRKFYERVNSDTNSFFWPPVAQRIAHLSDQPGNPPVTVRLTRHWRIIAQPGSKQNEEYNSFMFFEYVVDQRKLAEMRKSG